MIKGKRRKLIQRFLWAYFLLVIVEGALRKWIFPGLATPLLVIRDPICILAIYLGLGQLLKSRWAMAFATVGIVGLAMAMIVGHRDPFVALFGTRIWVLHFPLMFLFPAVFDRDDLWKLIRAYSWIAIPMTVLLAMQFYSPASHILNIGIGGEGDSVFSGAGGRNRCSGTFSFTNGVSSFYGLGGALFVTYLVGGPKPVPKWMWVTAGCLVIAMPLAISRSIAFQYAITVSLAGFTAGVSPRLLKTVVPAALAIAVIGGGLSLTPVFQDAFDAFSQRWEVATRVEGGEEGVAGVIQGRVIEYGILSAFRNWEVFPVLGMGIGIGTNVGAKLLTGERAFLVSEGSFGAILGEFGPPLGMLVIMLRLAFVITVGAKALRLVKRHQPAGIILGSFAFHTLFMGNPGQPTDLGFIILGGGFLLLAMRKPPANHMSNRRKPRNAESPGDVSVVSVS